MNIKYINLSEQWKKDKKYLLPKILKVFENGNYINGKEVFEFEKKISKLCKKNMLLH